MIKEYLQEMKRCLQDAWKRLKMPFALIKAEIQMRIAMRTVTSVHTEYKAKRNSERENRQFIVLLSIPIRRKSGKIVLRERLYWVDRMNFRKLKYKGWLPPHMKITELKEKAFYISNPHRSYEEEYRAKERAIRKYKNYIKATL